MDAFALFGFHATVGLKPNLAERNSKHMKCGTRARSHEKRPTSDSSDKTLSCFPDRVRGMMSALLDLHFPNRFIGAEDVVIPTTAIYASFIHALLNVGPKTWLTGLAWRHTCSIHTAQGTEQRHVIMPSLHSLAV